MCLKASTYMCRGQRTTLWKWFSPATFSWVLGRELWSPGFCVRAFTSEPFHWPTNFKECELEKRGLDKCELSLCSKLALTLHLEVCLCAHYDTETIT